MPSTTPTAGARIYAAHTPAPSVLAAACTSNLSTSSSTAADVVGASIPVTTVQLNAVAVVIGVFDMTTTSTGGAGVGTLVVDGVTQSGEAIHSLVTTAARETVAQVWTVTLAPGSHTLKLQGASSGAGTVAIGNTHTTITATVYDW